MEDASQSGLRNRFKPSASRERLGNEREEREKEEEGEERDNNNAPPPPSTGASGTEEESPFDCNICLSLPRDPIVTTCGHVYCWACIYKWIDSFREKTSPPVCPVCKNVIDSSKCIPIFGKGNNVDPRNTVPPDPTQEEQENLPPRPGPAPREEAPPRMNHPFFGFPMHAGAWGINFSAGFGMPGVAFGAQLPRMPDHLSPEQRRMQHLLSQVMLFLGMLVLVSLLLYP